MIGFFFSKKITKQRKKEKKEERQFKVVKKWILDSITH